ncbi:putative transposase [Bipolaris maydis]|nr:putative transposase [Bipolaris maydis]
MNFNRKYDYRRALCEDPELNGNMYNFDDTGFKMGTHNSSAVVIASKRRSKPESLQQDNRDKHHLSAWYKEDNLPRDWVIGVSKIGWTTNELGMKWLEHFDKHTKERTIGTHQEKIITLCMPPHSSHLLRPLGVGCFSPLKRAYGCQAEELMRNKINHITKIEFLSAFEQAYHKTITKGNIPGGFRVASLVPHDPEAVILRLDVKLRTPSPSAAEDLPWLSQTPNNTLELGSQSTLVKQKIQRHIDSSRSIMVVAFEKLAKGAAIIAQKLVLAQKRVSELGAANQAATQRRSHKRKRVQKGETLTVKEGEQLATLREFGARSDGKKVKKRARVQAGELSQRRRGRCGETGHHLRTYKQDIEDNSD